MKIGEESIAATKQMFLVHSERSSHLHGTLFFVKEDVEGKISISIDAWTSSNNYAFMAIIAHYVENDRGYENPWGIAQG
jgi:hypothetical protein